MSSIDWNSVVSAVATDDGLEVTQSGQLGAVRVPYASANSPEREPLGIKC